MIGVDYFNVAAGWMGIKSGMTLGDDSLREETQEEGRLMMNSQISYVWGLQVDSGNC